MKELLQLIHSDVREIKRDVKEQGSRLSAVEKLDAVQNEQLAEHMRRTEAAEKRLTLLETFKWIMVATAVIAGAAGKFLGVY